MLGQPSPPARQTASGDAEGEMPGTCGSVGWQHLSLLRCLRIKDQQHGKLADAEEHMTTRFPADERQLQDIAIKSLGAIEVVDVDTRLDDANDLVHGRLS